MECPNERMGNPNWRKGEKQLHSCTQLGLSLKKCEFTNYVPLSPLSMKMFATICHGRKFPLF